MSFILPSCKDNAIALMTDHLKIGEIIYLYLYIFVLMRIPENWIKSSSKVLIKL